MRPSRLADRLLYLDRAYPVRFTVSVICFGVLGSAAACLGLYFLTPL